MSGFHFEVKSMEVQERSGIAKVSGKAYTLFEQVAYFCTEDERRKVVLLVESPGKAYAVGRYMLNGSSLVVNQWGGLEVGRVSLVPVPTSKAA